MCQFPCGMIIPSNYIQLQRSQLAYWQHRNPILGYSKAPWGLSVLSRVTGIFTGTTISPGGLSRQCPNHYAFHAGQNLPDKEFRYLRTVIVTAAVHWGFDSMLAHLLLTFQHRAGVSSYTSSFDLAQTCVFGKQLLGPILCGSISRARPFPQVRDFNPYHIQSVIQIAAKSAVFNKILQIPIGCRNNSYIRLYRHRTAYTVKFSVLNHSQQFRLHIRLQFSDFVKKDCAGAGVTVGMNPFNLSNT